MRGWRRRAHCRTASRPGHACTSFNLQKEIPPALLVKLSLRCSPADFSLCRCPRNDSTRALNPTRCSASPVPLRTGSNAHRVSHTSAYHSPTGRRTRMAGRVQSPGALSAAPVFTCSLPPRSSCHECHSRWMWNRSTSPPQMDALAAAREAVAAALIAVPTAVAAGAGSSGTFHRLLDSSVGGCCSRRTRARFRESFAQRFHASEDAWWAVTSGGGSCKQRDVACWVAEVEAVRCRNRREGRATGRVLAMALGGERPTSRRVRRSMRLSSV